MVGDIVMLAQGDRVPADCMLIQEMDMKVDESEFFMEKKSQEKQISTGNNHL